MDSEKKHLVLILGPTAAGKSVLSVSLAERFDGEIVNCDSMQVYRGFDIGTDKPTSDMRRRVPHHLLDIVDPDVQFTAADFVREALKAITIISKKGKLPFLVGGTGLYFKALLEGLFPGPGRDESIRRHLEQEASEQGLDKLRRRLEEIDPDYIKTISRNDRRKIIRALEVFMLSGKPLSAHFSDTRPFLEDFHPLKIGIKCERAALYKRIESRVDRMFERGIVPEVQHLLENGADENAPPFLALGYKHMLAYLKGGITLEEAIALTKRDTRHFAKRQMTWFRKMDGIRWFTPGETEAAAVLIESYVHEN